MEIPFDKNTGEKYLLDIISDEIETGDGVVLTLNKKACASFAKIFIALAESGDTAHIHLGYDEECPNGPGFRIELNDDL